jgi:hypothetical protein
MAVSRINEAGLNVNQYGNRNLLINGAMTIDQRNSGSVVTPSDSQKTLDRFMSDLSAASKFSVQQVTDSPTDFSNSLKVTSLSAYTPSSSDFFGIQQAIEGFNTAQLNLGTANAKVITLSFYVKSSLTGTFGGAFNNSAHNRSYPYTYTISAANTWERKTITLTGDTSGTWIGSTNGIGLRVFWSMGAGSGRINTAGAWVGSLALGATGQTNVVATNAATWQVTGVQLEVGDTATDFEHRTFGDELQRCQRYYSVLDSSFSNGSYYRYCNAFMNAASAAQGTYHFPVEMRATPTLTASGTIAVYDGTNVVNAGSVGLTNDGSGKQFASIALTSIASGGVQYRPCVILSSGNTTSKIEFSAEL